MMEIEKRKKMLMELKPGDTVRMHSNYNILKLRTVDRVTPTLVILCREDGGKGGEFDRFNRSTGWRVPARGFDLERIDALATDVEKVKVTAAQAEALRKDAARRAETERKEKIRLGLDDLFYDTDECSVRVYWADNNREEKGFEVKFWGLSEKQVRRLAEITKEIHHGDK